MLLIKRLRVLLAFTLIVAIVLSSVSFEVFALDDQTAELGGNADVAVSGSDSDIAETSLATPQIKNVSSSGTDIKFTWDAVSGAYGYRLFYKTSAGWKAIATVTDTSYVWNGGVANTSYLFTIRCVSSTGNYTSSFDSSGYSFKYLNDTPYIKNIYSKSGNIYFEWDSVPGAYKYRIFYKTSAGWKAIATVSGTSYVWSAGVANTSYVFTIRCVNSSGSYTSSFDSSGYSFKYLNDTPYIKNVYSSSGNVVLEWDSVSGAYKYRIFYKTSAGWKAIATVSGNSYTWESASLGTTYTFTIRCLDSSGNYSSSFDGNGYTFKAVADTPRIIEIKPSGDNIIINWGAVKGVSRYRIFYKYGSSWRGIGYSTSASFTYSGVTYGTKYIFTVRCVDSSGNYISDFDRAGYVYTYFLNTPFISGVTKSGLSATFTWKSVTGAAKYRFFVKNGSSWKGLGYTSTNSFKVSGMSLNSTNTYTVRCVNSSNSYISGYNKTGYTFTLSYDTPKITNISYNSGNAVIKWSEIEGSPKYRLFYRNGSSWKAIATVSGTTYSYPMSINDTKTFTVRCCDTNGSYISSFDSNGYLFKCMLDTPKISSVSDANIAGAAVKISWGAVSGAVKYKVFYKNGSSWTAIASVSTNSYIWYFVEPNTSYRYTVRCIDSSGNYVSDFDSSGYTYTLSTSYLKTPKISSVKGASNNTEIVISWPSVSGASKYRVFYKNGTSWKTIGDTSSLSYTWKGFQYNREYLFTVRCVSSSGSWQSYFDSSGYSFTAANLSNCIELAKGMSYNCSKTGVSSWKSSNSQIAEVNSLGIVEGVSEGVCTISGGGYSFNFAVVESEPVRVAYTSPNSAQVGDTVSLIAITDTDKTSVRFAVGSEYVTASSKTVDSCSKDSSYKVYVWKASYKVTSAGEFGVVAYSKTSDSSWETCDNALTEIFVMKDRDSEVCAERRCSDNGIQFIAICEGLIPQIEDDTLAPGNFTVGYGRVVYQGQTFYNNLSKSQAYAYLVQTVNDGLYTSKTNSVLLNNKAKFKQQHFDALVSLVYNLGTGIYSDSDLKTLCSLANLSKATKSQVVAAFCDYHHASGSCIEGLLTRRVDECEIFLIGDYTRDYGNKNRCSITYKCSRGLSFP